jgi:DNA helicase-2/ATP-dependent DNA helicase PcrA
LIDLVYEVIPGFESVALANLAQQLACFGVGEATTALITQHKDKMGAVSLEDLLHDLNAIRDKDPEQPEIESEGVEESRTHVYCGTIHSSKSHEWDVVFLPAFEEGIIPHHGKREPTPAEIEEERRLAYVAVTRARQAIYISTADNRTSQWGTPVSRAPSRFIAEMGLTEENQIK